MPVANISPSPPTHKEIAIIGDGYSAAVAAYHLLDQGCAIDRIAVFGPSPVGLGQAYGPSDDEFRLNVRANLMAIDPNDLEAFPRWAEDHLNDEGANTTAGAFYRRADFARHLSDMLARKTNGQALHQISSRVVSAHHMPEQHWQITTEDGQKFSADCMILATGNPPSDLPFAKASRNEDAVITAPWRGDWRGQIAANDDVVIIGGGLTAMDAVASLYAADQHGQDQTKIHQGKISIITPHGVLPPKQLDWQAEGEINWPTITSASMFLRFFAQVVKPINWDDPVQQARFEELRIHINAAWSALPLVERQRLQKRLNWRWQLLRYRASPQAWVAVDGFTKSGQFQLINGRVNKLADADAKRINVHYSQDHALPDNETQDHTMKADKVIIATGAGKDPLIQQICHDGYADHMDGQLLLSDELQLLSPDGDVHHRAFALGPPSLLSKGDVMGASSIARQARDIAKKVSLALAT